MVCKRESDNSYGWSRQFIIIYIVTHSSLWFYRTDLDVVVRMNIVDSNTMIHCCGWYATILSRALHEPSCGRLFFISIIKLFLPEREIKLMFSFNGFLSNQQNKFGKNSWHGWERSQRWHQIATISQSIEFRLLWQKE